jgi:hypothetical protein
VFYDTGRYRPVCVGHVRPSSSWWRIIVVGVRWIWTWSRGRLEETPSWCPSRLRSEERKRAIYSGN